MEKPVNALLSNLSILSLFNDFIVKLRTCLNACKIGGRRVERWCAWASICHSLRQNRHQIAATLTLNASISYHSFFTMWAFFIVLVNWLMAVWTDAFCSATIRARIEQNRTARLKVNHSLITVNRI